MDTTIRNVDPEAYRRLKAWAAARGMTVGAAMSELIVARLPKARAGKVGFAAMPHEDFGPGSERLSENVDETLYG